MRPFQETKGTPDQDLSKEDLKRLLKTIDHLYAAACDPDKWPVFLQSAAELFASQGAQIGHHDLRNHTLSFSRLYGYDWSESHYRRYDELMPTDPRLPFFAANPFKPVHCRMHLSDSDLHNSQVYQEVLGPGGVEYSMGVNLLEDTRSLSYFLILRNKTQQPFDQNDCALLDALIPHLNRAILLQRDIGTIDLERNVAADTLDAMAIGLAIVDKQSKVMFANTIGREIIQEADGLLEKAGALVANGDEAPLLKTTIARVIARSIKGDMAVGEPLTLTRTHAKDPLQVFVSPLMGAHLRSGWARIDEPLAVLIIRDPLRPVETRREMLGKVYGLTASQARLVTILAEGLSVKDAANLMNITEASARQYLKIVFEKLDVSRQGELIAKVLNLPLPHDALQ